MADHSDPAVEDLLRSIALSNGFNAWLDLDLVSAGQGKCEIELQVTDDMRQHHGFAHGGIVGALADTATSWAAASIAGDVVTSSYSLQLMGAAKQDRLIGEGEVIKKGPRNVSVQGRVHTVDAVGERKLIAVSLATIAIVNGEAST